MTTLRSLRSDGVHGPLSDEVLRGAAQRGESDLRWVVRRSDRTPAVDALALGLRKTMRACADLVTFDRASFERVRPHLDPGALVVLAPTHRSYLDFLLVAYLCHAHPELRLPRPRIAAADDFARIPVVADLFRQAGAFFIRRGGGRDEETSRAIHACAQAGGSLMFFPEGQRSRSRHELAPKRGLLRALQATGQRAVVLPIAVTFDRLPEEQGIECELRGQRKPAMGVGPILGWAGRLARGQVRLGRVHLACGTPQPLEPTTDVAALARLVAGEHQRQIAVSMFHLRALALTSPRLDLGFVCSALRQRGARVLDSLLDGEDTLSAPVRQTLANQWMHWFYPDALRWLGDHPVVQAHVARHSFLAPTEGDHGPGDPRLITVLQALLEPVVADHRLALRAQMARLRADLDPVTPSVLVARTPSAHLPHLHDAFDAMVEEGLLARSGEAYTWGQRSGQGASLLESWDARLVPSSEPRVSP